MPASADVPPSRPESNAPAAVFWDMDGTLVDTEPLWDASQRRLVEDAGGTWRPEACVAIEDSLPGLESAAAAGLPVVAVPHVVALPVDPRWEQWTSLAGRGPADLARAARRLAGNATPEGPMPHHSIPGRTVP